MVPCALFPQRQVAPFWDCWPIAPTANPSQTFDAGGFPKTRSLRMFPVTAIARGSAQRPCRAGAFLSLLLLCASGCGSQTLFPVSGKVTYKDGKPVTAGFVIFEPLSQKIRARGEIQADGSFQL